MSKATKNLAYQDHSNIVQTCQVAEVDLPPVISRGVKHNLLRHEIIITNLLTKMHTEDRLP